MARSNFVVQPFSKEGCDGSAVLPRLPPEVSGVVIPKNMEMHRFGYRYLMYPKFNRVIAFPPQLASSVCVLSASGLSPRETHR
jgi:hypothetical protein